MPPLSCQQGCSGHWSSEADKGLGALLIGEQRRNQVTWLNLGFHIQAFTGLGT